MKFKMNGVKYTIKEVNQEYLNNEKIEEDDGYYYGKTYFMTQEMCIDNSLSIEKKRKTLIHELTHVYIREYLTTRDINQDEELLCDISANSHDIIHSIVKKYFNTTNTRRRYNDRK